MCAVCGAVLSGREAKRLGALYVVLAVRVQDACCVLCAVCCVLYVACCVLRAESER
jgi:hypothetical protein